jgi:hypothetical protein
VFSAIGDMLIMDQIGFGAHFGTCIPNGVAKGQTIRIFLKYMAEHPEKGHYDYVSGVVMALKSAFPCGSGPK